MLTNISTEFPSTNPKQLIENILSHQVIAHAGVEDSISQYNPSRPGSGLRRFIRSSSSAIVYTARHLDGLVEMSGQNDQAGHRAQGISLKDLIDLNEKDIRSKKHARRLRKKLIKLNKSTKVNFNDLIDLALQTKKAINKTSGMQSNFLLGVRDALVNVYLTLFKPLRDDENFLTKENEGDTDVAIALKAIIYRLRHNNQSGKQVSANLTYFVNEDAKSLFKALDNGWKTYIEMQITPCDFDEPSHVDIKTLPTITIRRYTTTQETSTDDILDSGVSTAHTRSAASSPGYSPTLFFKPIKEDDTPPPSYRSSPSTSWV